MYSLISLSTLTRIPPQTQSLIPIQQIVTNFAKPILGDLRQHEHRNIGGLRNTYMFSNNNSADFIHHFVVLLHRYNTFLTALTIIAFSWRIQPAVRDGCAAHRHRRQPEKHE